MAYFHSAYKLPPHYKCLLENNAFYFSRQKNKTMNFHSDHVMGRFNLEMDKVYNSFYMKLILIERNTTTKVGGSSIRLKRQTAHPDIVVDFKKIFEGYKNKNLQILNNVKYL